MEAMKMWKRENISGYPDRQLLRGLQLHETDTLGCSEWLRERSAEMI